MEKNFFPESISLEDQCCTIKEDSRVVSTLEGEEILFVEDQPLQFSDTSSAFDVFNSRVIISLVEED